MSAIDLRRFPFMPLHIARLQKSKAWLQCKRSPELAFYLMNLWMRSWHEIPAGSLDDDEDVLSDAAVCSPALWAKIRAKVLRNWEKRDDGRLYHPVVTEIAEDVWAKAEQHRQRTAKARLALQQKRNSASDSAATMSVTDAATEIVTEQPQNNDSAVTALKYKREGESKREEREEGTANAAPSSSKYAFESGIIRLIEKDLAQWKRDFSYLDVPAELHSLTEFAQKNSAKWFFAVQGALAKRNRDVKAKLATANSKQAGGGWV